MNEPSLVENLAPAPLPSRRSASKIIPPAPSEVAHPVWLSVSESAKLAGVGTKTIRRGLDSHKLTFKVVGNRYLINSKDLIAWLLAHTKLRNKFSGHGFGQYVSSWKQ